MPIACLGGSLFSRRTCPCLPDRGPRTLRTISEHRAPTAGRRTPGGGSTNRDHACDISFENVRICRAYGSAATSFRHARAEPCSRFAPHALGLHLSRRPAPDRTL